MQQKFIQINGTDIIHIESDDILIREPQDALELMAESGYLGSNNIVLHEKNLTPEFFDLKSKLAGEVLQKFSNYRMRLAIIGDFARYPGKSLRDFIRESNRQGRINFVSSVDEAVEKLSG
jgi:hypothetical protein